MAENKFDREVIQVTCASCGHGSKNHRVLYEKATRYYEEENGPELYRKYHRVVECMGCDSIKYVVSRLDNDIYGEYPEGLDEHEFLVYPDAPGNVGRRVARITQQEAENA